MAGGWLVSYIALWCVVLVMGIVILAHSRLLGILHHRFGPASAKALADGPDIGTKLDRFTAQYLDGSPWSWRFPAAHDLVLVFVSPQCETCTALTPHLKDFIRTHQHVRVVLLSTLKDRGMNEAFISYRGLQNAVYLLAGDLADEMGIQGTPYAVRLDGQGVVVAKGLVNHYEHLRSLLLAPTALEKLSGVDGAGNGTRHELEETKRDEEDGRVRADQGFL